MIDCNRCGSTDTELRAIHDLFSDHVVRCNVCDYWSGWKKVTDTLIFTEHGYGQSNTLTNRALTVRGNWQPIIDGEWVDKRNFVRTGDSWKREGDAPVRLTSNQIAMLEKIGAKQVFYKVDAELSDALDCATLVRLGYADNMTYGYEHVYDDGDDKALVLYASITDAGREVLALLGEANEKKS